MGLPRAHGSNVLPSGHLVYLCQIRGQSPQFSAHVYCGQTAGSMEMALGMEAGLGPGHILLDRDPAPFPKKGAHPQFLAHVYCGQMAGWIKMPLGIMEVGIGPGHTVLEGTQLSRKRGRPSIFGQCVL